MQTDCLCNPSVVLTAKLGPLSRRVQAAVADFVCASLPLIAWRASERIVLRAQSIFRLRNGNGFGARKVRSKAARARRPSKSSAASETDTRRESRDARHETQVARQETEDARAYEST